MQCKQEGQEDFGTICVPGWARMSRRVDGQCPHGGNKEGGWCTVRPAVSIQRVQ